MKTDAQLKDDVIEELRWDRRSAMLTPSGVGVKDGAVILSGDVPSYAEKLAAARAAERVNGLKAAANDLKVELPGAPRDDVDIAKAIAHVLEWNVQVPEGRVHATWNTRWVDPSRAGRPVPGPGVTPDPRRTPGSPPPG